jgi:hypothetical protein
LDTVTSAATMSYSSCADGLERADTAVPLPNCLRISSSGILALVQDRISAVPANMITETALTKYSVAIALLFLAAVSATAQKQTVVQSNLQEAIAARYRLSVVGPSAFGLRGSEESVRKIGGTLVIMRKGLYGTQERKEITSNGIRNNQRTLLSGKDEIELVPGERFFVTSVVVGQDFVSIGLLTVDPRNNQGRMGRVWSALNFFFDPAVIKGGDLNTINTALDQWILPADTVPNVAQPTLAAHVANTSSVPATIELKPGATRAEIETGLGKPIQTIVFGNKSWLSYPALVAVLEDDKLTSVDRPEQAFGNLSLSSQPGAEIFVDGELAGTTPTSLRVPIGSHKVELRMQGKNVWEQQVRVFPGADVSLKPGL